MSDYIKRGGSSRLLEKSYVYEHFDPKTGEIVYVGKGSGGRAWQCSPTDRGNGDHYKWLKSLLNAGYTPDDFVRVTHKNLSSDSAFLEESLSYRKLKPRFNRPHGPTLTLTPKQFKRAVSLRAKNMPYGKIAFIVGSSSMTIWRALNSEKQNYLEKVNV